MGTTEDMAYAVFFSGKDGGLELFVSLHGRAAERADSLFAGDSLPLASGTVLPGRRRKDAVGEDKQGNADENQENGIERTRYHVRIMHQNWPCRNR